jgi:hypothetical protein
MNQSKTEKEDKRGGTRSTEKLENVQKKRVLLISGTRFPSCQKMPSNFNRKSSDKKEKKEEEESPNVTNDITLQHEALLRGTL